MVDNIATGNFAGESVTLATTEVGGVHTPHHRDPEAIDLLQQLVDAPEEVGGATEATLAAVLAKLIAAPATEAGQAVIAAHVDGVEAALASILAKLIAAPATEAKQDALTTQVGVVGASPAANTVLARLKDILTLTSLAPSENVIGAVVGKTSFVDVTPVLDTSIYAAGDVLAATFSIPAAVRVNGGTGVLQSIAVIDQDNQRPAIQIFLLSDNVAFGTVNAAPSISDANAVQMLGAPITIGTADYTNLGGVAVAGRDGIGKVVKAASGQALYAAILLTAGTPTHTAAGIKLRFGFLQD